MSCLFKNKAPTHIVMVGYFDENFKWIQLFTVPCTGFEVAEKCKNEYDKLGEVKTQAVILSFQSL